LLEKNKLENENQIKELENEKKEIEYQLQELSEPENNEIDDIIELKEDMKNLLKKIENEKNEFEQNIKEIQKKIREEKKNIKDPMEKVKKQRSDIEGMITRKYLMEMPKNIIDLMLEKDRDANFVKLNGMFNMLRPVQNGSVDIETAQQSFNEKLNNEYVYPKFGGKEGFEKAMANEANINAKKNKNQVSNCATRKNTLRRFHQIQVDQQLDAGKCPT
jgi:chromosome segregation ATPase